MVVVVLVVEGGTLVELDLGVDTAAVDVPEGDEALPPPFSAPQPPRAKEMRIRAVTARIDDMAVNV